MIGKFSSAIAVMLIASCHDNFESSCNDNGSLYRVSDFPVGVAINYSEFKGNPKCREVATQQFNSYTPENIFKADAIHPAANLYYWTEADDLTDIALQNQKRIHGHTLIWHEQVPDWILNFSGSSADWEELFKSHIQVIVAHFKGKVKSWDVVNEAFNEDGTLRNSIWLQKLGANYIRRAFEYAYRADPDALLFYNDYNLESNPEKRKAVMSYFNQLKLQKVPVHGIGMQMHISVAAPDMMQVAEAFQEFHKSDLLLHVSELDVSVNPFGKDIEVSKGLLGKQASFYSEVFRLYKEIPDSQQHGITIWGISDKDSWIPSRYNREDYPLIYDSAYQPKTSYCKIIEQVSK